MWAYVSHNSRGLCLHGVNLCISFNSAPADGSKMSEEGGDFLNSCKTYGLGWPWLKVIISSRQFQYEYTIVKVDFLYASSFLTNAKIAWWPPPPPMTLGKAILYFSWRRSGLFLFSFSILNYWHMGLFHSFCRVYSQSVGFFLAAFLASPYPIYLNCKAPSFTSSDNHHCSQILPDIMRTQLLLMRISRLEYPSKVKLSSLQLLSLCFWL